MTTFIKEARRSFVKKAVGIMGLALLPKLDLLANKSSSTLQVGTLGIDLKKLHFLNNSLKNNRHYNYINSLKSAI